MNSAYYTIIGMDVGDRKTQVCVMARAAGAPKVVMETAIPTTREGRECAEVAKGRGDAKTVNDIARILSLLKDAVCKHHSDCLRTIG